MCKENENIETTEHLLNGTGIIELSNKCYITSNDFHIPPSLSFNTEHIKITPHNIAPITILNDDDKTEIQKLLKIEAHPDNTYNLMTLKSQLKIIKLKDEPMPL